MKRQGDYKDKERYPFKDGETATPKRQRDEMGRWLPGALPEGRAQEPMKTPTEDDLAQIRRLAAKGHGTYSVAEYLGIARATFDRWRRDYPEVAEAWHRGLEEEEHLILGQLLKILKDKQNPIPGIFLLKSRHGYREGESNQADNRVQIQVTLPAALQKEEYQQLVDVKKPTNEGDGDE